MHLIKYIWHPGVEICRSLLRVMKKRAFVGWCIDRNKMHRVSNIDLEIMKLLRIECQQKCGFCYN
jgi:hypothetical protein